MGLCLSTQTLVISYSLQVLSSNITKWHYLTKPLISQKESGLLSYVTKLAVLACTYIAKLFTDEKTCYIGETK